MAFREQLTLTTAPSGAGKTYVRCARFLVNEFLPLEQGVSWSNYPVNLEAITEHFIKKQGLKDEEADAKTDEIRRRVRSIPEDVLQEWQEGVSGPWDFFSEVNLEGAHISLDEAHVYIRKDRVEKWAAWIGAIRHAGATFEMISQTPGKIPKSIIDEAGAQIFLTDSQGGYDPFFKIQMADWYEMKAKLTGRYVSYFVESRLKRYGMKFKPEKTIYHARDPVYFAFYNSYNQVGNVQGSEAQKHEFEKRSWFSLCYWFFIRNCWALSLRGGGAALLLGVVLSLPFMTKIMMARMREHQANVMNKNKKEVDGIPVPAPQGKDKHGNPDFWPKPALDAEGVRLLQAENEELSRTVRSISTSYQRLKSMHESMIQDLIKAKQSRDAIGMLFADKAVTVGGRVVTIGDVLNTLEGEKEIKAFDYDKSKIEFTDDSDMWVTIGQRRMSDQAQLPQVPADEQADQGIDSAGRRTGPGRRRTGAEADRNGSNHRAASVLGDQHNRQADKLHDNSQSRPTIYSRYVGPQRTADRQGNTGSFSVPGVRTNQTR